MTIPQNVPVLRPSQLPITGVRGRTRASVAPESMAASSTTHDSFASSKESGSFPIAGAAGGNEVKDAQRPPSKHIGEYVRSSLETAKRVAGACALVLGGIAAVCVATASAPLFEIGLIAGSFLLASSAFQFMDIIDEGVHAGNPHHAHTEYKPVHAPPTQLQFSLG